MQFAGIRTDKNLEPIGEPYDLLVKLNDDTLPSPDALLVTGITPQKTLEEGYSEAEFAKILSQEIFIPDTITVGFNNIRFDDEFIRHTLWRNFYDPYEWAYADGRSRWDLLDVVRMTRALRPDGIEWPVDSEGKPTNRLELLTARNGLNHENAHDALSDVYALIAVTRLIRQKQPQLFNYLLKLRDKTEVKKLVNLDDKAPFVYASGRYDSQYEKTTVAFPLTAGRNGNVVVYDLRHDPNQFVGMSERELAANLFASWEERKAKDFMKLPVKELQYNRAPAVAPLGVLTQSGGWRRIQLDEATVKKHLEILLKHPEFAERLRSVFEHKRDYSKSNDVGAQLYNSFVPDKDKPRIEAVRNATVEQLADFQPDFSDERLPELLLQYKARNFPSTLSDGERAAWETWRSQRLMARLPGFMKRLGELAQLPRADRFLLEEMQLWAESIAPLDSEG